MLHAAHYFDRAVFALQNASNDELAPSARSHLTAAAVHACQSLMESLDQVAEASPTDTNLADSIKKLPHVELINNVRNLDLHGWPLPICDPNVRMMAMVSKPGQPIQMSSSHGVAVTMQMDGLKPKISRSPKDIKHGKVTIGGATVSFGCDSGVLVVHDFSTSKDYALLVVLKEFLRKSHSIIKSRIPPPVLDAGSEDGSSSHPPSGGQ